MKIRFAKKRDIRDLGKLHHQCWMETYDSLLKPDYLRKLSVEKSIAMMEAVPLNNVLVVETESGLVGFSCFDGSRDDDFKGGEIIAMYLLQKAQGFGYGRRLLNRTEEALAKRNHKDIMLWVLETNRHAIGFYEAMGFEKAGFKKPFAIALDDAKQLRMVKHIEQT